MTTRHDLDKTIRELQSSLPWTAHYHRDFRSTPMTHKDFGHALLHIHKASGKLAAIIDEAEHAGFDWADPAKRAQVEKYVADMVICALRMANTCPDGVLDLQAAVERRLVAKNNQLAADAVPLRGAP
jgi:RES domain-containing protein